MMTIFAAADALPAAPSPPDDAAGAVQSVESSAPSWFDHMSVADWFLLGLVVLLALVVLFILVRFMVRRTKLRKMVGTMREDLLLRRELASMVAGKDLKSQQREQYLRTENIRMDLAAAHRTMQDRGLSPRQTSSWFLLGEPGSGKSRLMEYGGIQYPAGINDFSLAAEATSTFNMWLADKGIVWDIGGRLFLSRWGGRVDHEWQTFLDGYVKIFKNNLVNGVILTIPSDALMLDPAELRDRKISLIAEEMRVLSRISGSYCPVWVVITKCDQLDGFSEFCSLLRDQDCEMPLGWQNPNPERPFDPSLADSAFNHLIDQLKDLRAALALNEQVWEKCTVTGRRDEIAIPVYRMPEAFEGLRENLKRYLAGIFTHVENKKSDRGIFQFSGVWFTAALDQPVTVMERVMFRRDGENLTPVVLPEGDSPLPAVSADASSSLGGATNLISVREKIVSVRSPRHFFTARLLQHIVLGTHNRSDFTDSAARRVRRPYRIAAACLLIMAVPLMLCSAFNREHLSRLAGRYVDFWARTHDLFVSGAVNRAPIIAAEKGHQVPLTDAPMPGTQTSRREYLYNLDNMATLSPELPLFWRAASWVTDGESSHILLEKHKKFINKAAVVCMLLRPVVDSARSVLTYRAEHYAEGHSAWDKDDTMALATLMQITNYGIRLMNGQHLVDDIVYADLVRLDDSPSHESAIKSLWSTSTADNKTILEMSALNGYLKPVSMEAAQAITAGVALYSAALDSMELYLELNYPVMRRFLENLLRMQQLQGEMKQREDLFCDAVRKEDAARMQSCRTEWKHLYDEACALQGRIEEDEHTLDFDDQNSLREGASSVYARIHAALEKDIHRFDALGMNLGDSKNADFLRHQVLLLHRALLRKIPLLSRECDSIPQELCTIWDRAKDADSEPRPWQRYMTYAKTLNDLLFYPLPVGDARESFHRRIARVKETKKRYDESVATLGQREGSGLDASCWEQNWHILVGDVISTWLRDVPQSNTAIIPPESLPRTPRSLPAIPYTRAGKYTLSPTYDPASVDARLSDLNELSAFVHEHLAAGQSRHHEEITHTIETMDEACKHFLVDYVMYWTEEIPAQYKLQGIRSWSQFVESGDVFVTSDVTGMLREVNELMLKALSISCLRNKELFPDIPGRIEEISRAQKDLNPETRRNFLHTADFISRLDLSPVKAWQYLVNLPVDELFKQYWVSWYTDESDSSFLWWNDYLSSGMRLLKKEAANELRAEIRGCLPFASMFPLCNTPLRRPNDILSSFDLESLQERLDGISGLYDDKQDAEIAKQAALRNIPADSASLRLDLPKQREKAWGKASDVVHLLADPELPLSATFILPKADVRKAPVSGEDGKKRLLPVVRRFPYCRVTRDGAALSSLVNLNRQNDADVELTSAPIPVETGDLQFEFFRRADAASPDCTVKFPGSWSSINLYLRRGVHVADDRKTAYVPLSFRDREGYSCVFWVGVRFNREMIPPGEWLGSGEFDESPVTREDDAAVKEKELRKAIRAAFLTDRNLPRTITADDRQELLRSIRTLLGKSYSIAFEVVMPSATEMPQEDRLRSCALFPYFAVGSADGSSGKLRAVPDSTQTSSFFLPGKVKMLLRLYRHAHDEFSAMYIQQQQPLLDFVIDHASAYSPIPGYFSVPVRVSDSSNGSLTYTLYLRPFIKVFADDGLLPEDGEGMQTEYTDEDLPL